MHFSNIILNVKCNCTAIPDSMIDPILSFLHNFLCIYIYKYYYTRFLPDMISAVEFFPVYMSVKKLLHVVYLSCTPAARASRAIKRARLQRVSIKKNIMIIFGFVLTPYVTKTLYIFTIYSVGKFG